MEIFYYIKIIDKQDKKGYVSDPLGTGIVIEPKLSISHILKFQTYTSARAFVRTNKLDRGGDKAYIRDTGDILNDEGNRQVEILGQKKQKD